MCAIHNDTRLKKVDFCVVDAVVANNNFLRKNFVCSLVLNLLKYDKQSKQQNLVQSSCALY